MQKLSYILIQFVEDVRCGRCGAAVGGKSQNQPGVGHGKNQGTAGQETEDMYG